MNKRYNAWREFEAYAYPVTESGIKAMQRRMNQFISGYNAAIKDVINILETHHECSKDSHNYYKVAANLIESECLEKIDEGK